MRLLKNRRLVGLLVAILLVAGCGSSGGSAAASAPKPASKPATSVQVVTNWSTLPDPDSDNDTTIRVILVNNRICLVEGYTNSHSAISFTTIDQSNCPIN